MAVRSVLNELEIRRAITGTAAGQTTITGDIIDMAQKEKATFIGQLGVIDATGVPTFKVQQGALADMSDAADLAGSAVAYTATDDNKLAIIEVKPSKRYIRLVSTRATADATIGGGCVLLTGKKQPADSLHATVKGSKELNCPAEGTA